MPDPAEDVATLERAAGAGDLRAMVALATEYELGRNRPRDLARAEAWYRRAAVADDAEAQYWLGALIWRESPDTRLEERNGWLLRAAEGWHPRALFWLGQRYEGGLDGFMCDPAAAMQRYREAAERGSVDARLRLGIALVKGDLGARDGVEARRWLSAAYRQGRPSAGYWLRMIPFMRLPLPPRAPTIAMLRALGLALLGLHAIRAGIELTGALLGMLGFVAVTVCVALGSELVEVVRSRRGRPGDVEELDATAQYLHETFHRRPLELFRSTAGEDGIALVPIILFGFNAWSVAASACLFGAFHYPGWSAKSCTVKALAYGSCVALLVPHCGLFAIVAGHFLLDSLLLFLSRPAAQ